jgi:glycosyltransferase involved in cell wall biosynthesis
MQTVSIITATLNRASLPAVCNSIDRQSFREWHHYVIGDGVRPAVETGERRTVLGFTTPLGASEPSADKPLGTPNPIFRWAIDHLMLGECVCFLDDDNTFEPDFLEKMYRALKASSAGIVLCALNDCRQDDLHDGFPELGRCDTSGFLVYTWAAKEVRFPRVVAREDNIEDFRFIKACADRFGWVRVPDKLVNFGVFPAIVGNRSGF